MSDADPESEIEALKRDPAFRRGGKAGGKGFTGAATPDADTVATAAPVSDADRKWELKARPLRMPSRHRPVWLLVDRLAASLFLQYIAHQRLGCELWHICPPKAGRARGR